MSQGNLEIVHDVIDAYNSGDLDGQLKHFSASVEVRTSGLFSGIEAVYRGREGYAEFWNSWQEAWQPIQIETERVEQVADRVLVLGKFSGTGRGSGVIVERPVGVMFTFGDGLVERLQTFGAWADALEAVGLSE